MDIEIIRIGVEAILGCTTVLGFVLYHRQTKRMKNAEALNAEIEADQHQFDLYKAQLYHCSESVEQHNETIKHQSETICTLNDALDDKTARIRELTDKLWESEKESNELNAKLIEKTERIGQLELMCQKYKDWHCRVADCIHRLPPNPTLKGRKFEDDENDPK